MCSKSNAQSSKRRHSTFNQHLKRRFNVDSTLQFARNGFEHRKKKSPYKYIRYPVFNIYQKDKTLGLQYRSSPTDVYRPVQKKIIPTGKVYMLGQVLQTSSVQFCVVI